MFCTVSAVVLAADGNKPGTPVNGISRDALRDFAYQFFDATNVTWKVNGGYQTAVFNLDGKSVCAMYSQDGQFLMASEQVTADDLPAFVTDEISRKYGEYTVAEAVKVLARPAGYKKHNDVGSYWTALRKGDDVVYLVTGEGTPAKLVRKMTLN
ncbi:MAG TPA: hypothetical protein VGD92_03720 [Sphingobacteriaceae bacterium]